MKKTYCKIVRDRIPEIIERSGKRARFEYATPERTLAGLTEKLVEEAEEFRESGSIEELADVCEVIHGILRLRGLSVRALEETRLKKRAERGGFLLGVRLLEVDDGISPETPDC